MNFASLELGGEWNHAMETTKKRKMTLKKISQMKYEFTWKVWKGKRIPGKENSKFKGRLS